MSPPATHVATPPPRPLLVWDGDCRFCGMWVRRWRRHTGEAVDYAPSQEVGGRFPELTRADYDRAVHLIQPDGRVWRGAEAVYGALACRPGGGRLLALYQGHPLLARLSDEGYSVVARNRTFFSWLTRLLWGDPSVPSTYQFAGLLFVRSLGLVFLVAFLSFWAQAAGLVGAHGLVPVSNYFDALREAAATPGNPGRFSLAPTLLWLAPNDTGLYTVLGAGTLCAVLAMVGLVPAWALLGCVLAYGSLRNGVFTFLDFQWDALLVETGFAALLVAPWGWWQLPVGLRDPPRVGRWVLWLLLFKLMFLSGLVKILTNGPGPAPAHSGFLHSVFSYLTGVPIGENRWLDGTALQYHYFTQPLPSPLSWWFAQRPEWFQAWTLWAMMFVEIAGPFGFFGPRRVRHLAALAQVFLQIVLMATGNYGFFNLLAIVLCLPLFDDAFWPAKVQRLLARSPPAGPAPVKRPRLARVGSATRWVIASFIILVDVIELGESWRSRTRAAPPPAPGLVARVGDQVAGFAQRVGLVNPYGLFRVMTTERPEIIIEGSDDGTTWQPYEFYWKPGDVNRPPAFVEPHMPRLDWQMWFAALQIYGEHSVPAWLPAFLMQVAQGNPWVLGLLEKNPFPGHPPRYLRAQVSLYRFTTEAEHEKTGAWWVAQPQPDLTLQLSPK